MWPAGFRRIPDDDWTRAPVDTLALKYDTVENHGWYANLAPTVADLAAVLRDGHLLIDYSGGTGILVDRLLHAFPHRGFRVAIVDASPKFLRLALEKFRGDERIAFRHIRYLQDAGRLEFVDEVLDLKADAIVSTNAVHLYFDLDETLRAWRRILKPGAPAFVQSGNIRSPAARPGEWIIDETVDAIHEAAARIARRDARWAAHRAGLDNVARMAKYAELRRKYFLPVRPLAHYLDALARAGFAVERVSDATIEARVGEWYDFLAVYHEGVLGWVGGAEKIEGRAPAPAAVDDRLALLRTAMEDVFAGRASFPCCWTYIAAR